MAESSLQTERPSFAELLRVFARIGVLSFGGPAGQIALMHRELVEQRKWLDEERFLHALNYCMLLPGPEAMQLATYAGWLMHGVRGGLAAGLLFVLPGAALIVCLSALYMVAGEVPAVQGLLFGLKAAVLAVVAEALVKISKRALRDPAMVAMAVAALAIAFLAAPFPLIIAGAAAIGALAHAWSIRRGGAGEADRAVDGHDGASARSREGAGTRGFGFARTLAIWLGLWLVPMIALYLALGGSNVFTTQAVFFSKMAAVTFGGAYAVLAYVGQQAVDVHGWLRPDEMLTGVGLAETTPGPLILVLVFVGFLGGARLSGLDPITGGLAGAAVTLWFTFVPCFLWIFAGAPYVERVRHVLWLKAALAAVTAAVVGVIANLALWFGIHMLFADVGTLAYGPFAFPAPDLASFEPVAAGIALAAVIALIALRAPMIVVLALSALAGLLLAGRF